MSDKKQVLVIDDDPDIISSVKAILEKNDIEVSTAMSGKEAIELLSKSDPDVVFCDMMMESIDSGVAVAREIRGKNKDLKIYLMSSVGNETAKQTDIYEMGFSGVFQKPVDPDKLIKAVG